MQSNEFLFKLPDEGHLSYVFPWDLKRLGKQHNWYHSYYDFRVVHKTPTRKSHSPRLGLWTSRSNQKFICADFDRLPKGYNRWEKFEKSVREKFPNDYVFLSASGKVKILFLIEFKSGYLDSKMAKYALSQILPKNWFEIVDTSYFGMSITYLNPSIVEGLRRFLKNNPKPRKVNMAPLFAKTVEGHFFKMHEGPLPKYLKKFTQGNKSKEVFARVLLRQRRMAMKSGFDIPTTKFARELGVSQKTVHRWRTELVEIGFIKCVDESYMRNKKAMTFKAIGLFKKTVIRIFTSVKTKIKTKFKKDISLPTSIEDGNWHSTIWFYSKYFINRQEEFIQWVQSVPDSHTKGRLKKATYALVSRLKYNDMEYHHLVK